MTQSIIANPPVAIALPPGGAAATAAARSGNLGFALLLAVLAVLFLRPAELVPVVRGWPIYEVLILACLAASLPLVLEEILGGLRDRPITLCVIALLGAVVMSHLSHAFIWGARHSGPDFTKLVLFYLLIVALVSTKQRFALMMKWIWTCIVIVTLLALMQYHRLIDLPALQSYQEAQTNRIDPATGEAVVIERLCGAGIFNDPNDFCLILVFGLMLSLYRASDRRAGLSRVLCSISAGLFVWAIALTHSRGGFLALLAAMAALIVARFGPGRAILTGFLLGPLILYAFAGRQTDLAPSEGTALSRIQLWSEALRLFKRAPLFGIGMGQFAEEIGLVVHNSFLQCFVELGLFGGAIFFAAFCIAFDSLHRLRRAIGPDVDQSMLRFRPYLLAILLGYVVGYLALTRSYSLPTYLLLAVVVCYVRLAAPTIMPRVTTGLAARMGAMSIAFIGASYVFIRLFVRW